MEIPKKKYNSKLLLSYLVIFIILGLVIFLVDDKKSENTVEIGEKVPVNEQIKPDTLVNPFNFLKVKIGDVVSGLEVVELGAFTGDETPTINNLTIRFKNKKLISGQANYYQDGFLQGKVCLENYNPYEQKNLPRVEGDTRLTFVCFNNPDDALKKLYEIDPKKTISINIDNYTINLNNENAVNTADLVD